MPSFGGMSPYPRRFGGGRSRLKDILRSLNNDRGDAYDATNRETTVYVHNMAIARAISAAWGTNQRLGNLWVPTSMTDDVLVRWEEILGIIPGPDETPTERRERVAFIFSHFGKPLNSGRLIDVLTEQLGDFFVSLDFIDVDNAVIFVPDGTYPFGTTNENTPWYSTVAHVLVRTQVPANRSESEFLTTMGRLNEIVEPLLPAWVTFDWYRPGATSTNVPGGPTAGGFYLDEANNLDNQVFAS